MAEDRWQEIEDIVVDRCVPEGLRGVRDESAIMAETVLGWLAELRALHADETAALTRDLATADGQIQNQQRLITALTEQRDAVTRALRKQNLAVAALTAERDALAQRNRELEQAYTAVKANARKWQERAEQIERERDNRQAQLHRRDGTIYELQNRLAEMRADRDAARDEVERLRAELERIAWGRGTELLAPEVIARQAIHSNKPRQPAAGAGGACGTCTGPDCEGCPKLHVKLRTAEQEGD